jgi:hypothetical protein
MSFGPAFVSSWAAQSGREERTVAQHKQGDLDLLQSDVAQRLLASTIPARFAYIAGDGTPRVLATWFHWTGEVLSMPTFLAAPHLRHPPGRLGALRANPAVAVTIDTESFPPEVLTVCGRVRITKAEGIPPASCGSRRAVSRLRQARSRARGVSPRSRPPV